MTSEEILTRMELLRIARELVINEYIDRRAQDHNSWLANSDMAWRTQKVKVPYPTFPAYPSELDIIGRANVLNEFINGGKEVTSTAATNAVIDTIMQVPVVPSTDSILPVEKVEPVAEPVPQIIETVVESVSQIIEPIVEPIVEPVAEPVSQIIEPVAEPILVRQPEHNSQLAHVLKIFDAEKMPDPIIPVAVPVATTASSQAAAIMDIFKPATSGTMESIEIPEPQSLNSVANAVIGTAAARNTQTDDSAQTSSFSSLLPSWLLKK